MVKNLNVEELNWQQARVLLAPLNPALVNIIDKISPGKEFKLLKAEYKFGDCLLNKAKLNLPLKNLGTIPLDHPDIPTNLQENYSYNFSSNPVAILLNRTSELFINLNNRIIPFALAKPGKIIGAWRVLDDERSHAPATNLWGMTAGVRSLFMLPKISKQISHQRLKKHFHIQTDKPHTLQDHWKIFKALCDSERFPTDWEMEILYFNNEWFKYLDDKHWKPFQHYLLESAWKGSSYWRNQFIWDSLLSNIRHQKELVPSPQTTDLTKHILMIGIGVVPGFEPAINDSAGPISTIQNIYTDIYKLDNYAPIIMQPNYFSMYSQSNPIYYSLQVPTALEFSPKSSKHSTSLSDLYDIGSLLKKYFESIDPVEMNLQTTPMGSLSKLTKYDLFHTNTGSYTNILPCSVIPKQDSRFLHEWKNTSNSVFPPNSSFFNGCIRIANKQ